MNILMKLENLDSGVIQASMVSFFDLFLILIFTILNGFFVTAEFSLLRIPKTMIATFKGNGGRREAKLDSIFQDFNLYISSVQIGISLTSLLLGWLGVGVFIELTRDVFSSLGVYQIVIQVIGFLVGLFIVLTIHSILGEIAPKMLSIQNIESIALNIAYPVYYFTKLMKPISIFHRRTAYYLLKTFRLNPQRVAYTEVFSEDELKFIIAQSKDEGEIDETEHEMIERVLDFTDTTVKSILTPRYRIISFPIIVTAEEIIHKAKETGYSRFPIYNTKLDEIRGFIHIKDIITADINKEDFSISEIMREVVIVHEGMMLDVLLRKMQKRRSQLAIIVDEYGSVEGLATIEDVIEEIVGEIDDEFDEETTNLIKLIAEDTYLINADISLDEFNESFEVDLNIDEAVTLAGFILEHLDELPTEGSELAYNECEFKVMEMDGNRISKIQLMIKKTNISPERDSE